MKIIVMSVILVASVIRTSHTENPKTASSHTFLKHHKNIYLSSRELQLPDNRKTREFIAKFVVKADAARVLKVIKNDHYATTWMKGVKEFSTIRKVNDNDWYTYIQYEVPWPLNDQDCIIRYQCTETEHGKGYELNLIGAPDFIPLRSGVERISHLCGRWTITTESASGCCVEYRIYSTQRPKYPRWVTDPIIQGNLINTMASLRELSENKQMSEK